MPVKVLSEPQDQLMLDILATDLPGNDRVVRVRVELTWVTEGAFVAFAKIACDAGFRKYSSNGNTVEGALLELAANIILNYPGEVDINVPVSDIVNTRTFKLYFRRDDQKGDD